MKKEKMYSIAIRKRIGPNDFFWENIDYQFRELNINCKSRYWLADPFIIEHKGKTYVFYEAFDMLQRKGKLGYSIMGESSGSLPIHIILDKPYHLSFPYVFEHNGDMFLIPETCNRNEVVLFQSTDFPHSWAESKVLLPDIFSCDSVIAENKKSDKILLTSEMYRDKTPTGNYSSCWVKNVKYRIDKDFNILDNGVIVAEGDCGIRNAGKVFSIGEKIFRVGQNSPNKQYGKGVALFEILSIEPYIEKLIWIKDCGEFEKHITKKHNENLIGVHTYNFSEHFEVIDFSQIRRWSLGTITLQEGKTLRRKIRSLRNRIKK